MPATFARGDRVGPYIVREEIGVGGMGEVYRVTDGRLGRDVALKVLPRHAADDPVALARFEREARAVAALSHPNVLVLHDVGEDAGVRYVVTELLQGETLRQRLDRGVPPWTQTAEWLAAVADGLAAAHARQVIHRDLNPRNLFLTRDGFLKVLDFGLAFFHQDGAPAEETVTRTGTVVGTSGYMAPEQLSGDPVDARADLFSLGCVLYEMLTGRRPFEGRSFVSTMASVLRDEPPPPSRLVPELPAALDTITLRCLAKAPDDRYASAREVAAALRAARDGAPMAPPPTARPLAVGAGEVGPGTRSLAVLPFVDGTGDPEGAYLADGLSEALIRDVSRRGGIRVLAWSTAARYRGGAAEPRATGAALGVDAVLVGRLHEIDQRLVVTAELVDVTTGQHLWGDRLAGTSPDVLELQDELARRISRQLRTWVDGGHSSAAESSGRRARVDPQAYASYLRGRYYWNRRSAEDLARSRGHFRAALDVDPTFASAWAGLADTYNVAPFWGLLSPQDAFPKAKAACRRAIELDHELAEAHTSLAYVSFYYDWSWEAAAGSFRTALDLDPHYATAHHWYGVTAALSGRFELALTELRLALEIDPLSLIIQADQGLVHYWRGNLEAAQSSCAAALEIEPSFAPAQLYRGLIEEQAGDLAAAVRSLRAAVAASHASTVSTAALGHALARSGERAEAEELQRELTNARMGRYVSPYLLAILSAGLDDHAALFAHLEEALRQRAETLTWLHVDPRLAPFRGDPRMAAIDTRAAAARES